MIHPKRFLVFCFSVGGTLGLLAGTVLAADPDYNSVNLIFSQHCLDCHAAKDPENGLVLETFEDLMKGGEAGPAVLRGKSSESLLIRMVEGRVEKGGKTKIMPPGRNKKLSSSEISTLKAWIDSGAKAPMGPVLARQLAVPKISPKSAPRNPVNALAFSASGKIVAAARYSSVELRDAADLHVIRTCAGFEGNVNAVLFSADARTLFGAAGQPAIAGEVRQWKVAEDQLVKVFAGHKDAIYSLALSPDGNTLATGSYDQKIKLWDVATGKEIRTLSGHNGCVYQLSFRPDGKILASASADRTVKLWDIASGERRETFSQSFKEVYAVAFSPDGQRVVAGGGDNRIRVWEISPSAAETTNPLLYSKFAHEGAILALVFSTDGKTLLSTADDRTVKLWDPLEMKEQLNLERQSDWAPALAFGQARTVFVGRLDGTITSYDAATGKRL